MRILDRYISRSIIQSFFSAIFLFCFLYILIDLSSHLDDFIANKVSAQIIATYYLSFLPIIFVQTAPIACLLATLFTYSALNNNNEVIALRASGLNFWGITRPAIILSITAAALVFLVNEQFVPGSLSLSQDIKNEKLSRSSSEKNKPQTIKNLFFYGLNNRLFFINLYDPATRSLQGITIIGQNEQQQLTEKIVAMKGVWVDNAWTFTNCQLTYYNPNDPTLTGDVQFFKEKSMDINETPDDLLKQRNRVSAMNIRQLKVYIKRFKGSGAVSALNSLKVDLHQKMAYPLACIAIIFVGLPFALTVGNRKGLTFASVGSALVIGFLFYVVNAIGIALGKGNILPPVLAAWSAPFLFCGAGIYSVRKLF